MGFSKVMRATVFGPEDCPTSDVRPTAAAENDDDDGHGHAETVMRRLGGVGPDDGGRVHELSFRETAGAGNSRAGMRPARRWEREAASGPAMARTST